MGINTEERKRYSREPRRRSFNLHVVAHLTCGQEALSLLAHEVPPFADYAWKVSTKSGEDQPRR